MDNLLKVTAVSEVKKDKNETEYLTVYGKPVKIMPDGSKIGTNFEPKHRNLYAGHTDNQGRVFKGDSLFEDFKNKTYGVGSYLEGCLTRIDTTPYEINGKQVTSKTLVVFSNENVETVAKRELKGNKASMVLNGITLHEENLVNSSTTITEPLTA